MSDGVDIGASQSYDVFDDVVETGDFDGSEGNIEASSDGNEEAGEVDSGEDSGVEDQNSEEDSGEVEAGEEVDADEESESEETKEEEPESQEDEEVDADEEDGEESEEGKDDEGPSVDLAKAVEDGTLEVEVDGGDKVSLADLKKDYAGQQEVARRFSDLDVQKKSHESDVQEIEQYINDFAGLMRKGDALGAMSYFGDFGGMPAHQVKEALITQLGPEIVRRQSMSLQEIQAEYLQAENKHLHEQRESEAEIREKEQANSALQASIQNLRETQGISEQEWGEVSNELQETLGDDAELTPENIAEAVTLKRSFTMAESVYDQFSGQLSEEQGDLFFNSLLDVKEQYPHFTEEDLKEVASEAVSQLKKTSTKEKLENKVASKKKMSPKKKQQSSQTQPESNIDPELEDWL